MKDGKVNPGEGPEELRQLARRARFLASRLNEPDKSRIEAYADELEKLAEKAERSREDD